jgi:hypothetical protein
MHTADQILQRCTWKLDATGWRLVLGKRCFGRVVPDQNHPGMWRSVMPGGRRLSDKANLSWAKHAVAEVARRELEYEARQHAQNWPKIEGLFAGEAAPVRQNGAAASQWAEGAPVEVGAP